MFHLQPVEGCSARATVPRECWPLPRGRSRREGAKLTATPPRRGPFQRPGLRREVKNTAYQTRFAVVAGLMRLIVARGAVQALHLASHWNRTVKPEGGCAQPGRGRAR